MAGPATVRAQVLVLPVIAAWRVWLGVVLAGVTEGFLAAPLGDVILPVDALGRMATLWPAQACRRS